MNQLGDQFRKTQHSMKKTYAFSLILLTISLLLPSCNAKFDIVTFSAVGLMPAAKTPIPTIEIDTNVSAGMMGGDVKSNKPYNIRTDYMDDTFTFASAEYTKVTVTYADGTTDPGIAELKLPMRFQHRIYESPNSMAGGVVVITKSRVIQAEFPDTISRDEAFTLQIEGSFTKDDGSIIPFKIKEKYNISRDKKTVSWADYVSGC
jgi:hypothetical protein